MKDYKLRDLHTSHPGRILKVKTSFPSIRTASRAPKMGDGGVFRRLFRPVEELEYTCLLKNTLTEASHDRGFKTCQTPVTYPECLLWKNVSVGGGLRRMSHGPQHFENNNCQGKGCRSVCRITIACAESQSTSRGPNRTRFLAVQVAIRAKMQCDKKSLLAAADASKQLNLMVVGGHSDNVMDLCGEDNDDVKRQCLGKGETMLTKPPIRRNSILLV